MPLSEAAQIPRIFDHLAFVLGVNHIDPLARASRFFRLLAQHWLRTTTRLAFVSPLAGPLPHMPLVLSMVERVPRAHSLLGM